MARPRAATPSKSCVRKRFERARRKAGLVSVDRVLVARQTIDKLIRRGELSKKPTKGDIASAITQLIADITSVVSDGKVRHAVTLPGLESQRSEKETT